MFWTRFLKRRSTVVERIAPYTKPQTITVELPATVEGALLAIQIEHQLKRRGIA